jgi:hypothetical protein
MISSHAILLYEYPVRFFLYAEDGGMAAMAELNWEANMKRLCK